MVEWIRNTLWWHVYPLGFLGAEQNALAPDHEPISRLRSFEPWLDYVAEIGCNGLLFTPIFASESHGYDTTDFYNLDSRLGTNTDLIWFIELCRERDIKVVLDGVFNHVGRSFGPFQDVKYHRQNSRYSSWFHIDWNNTHNEDGFSYGNFEGHHRLVKLNHNNPEVVDYVANVLSHWLSFGINGWRLDAAYAVAPHFWQQVLDRVRQKFPDAWFLGEVIHGDYSNFVRQGHMESVTQYELWKAIWSGINDRNFFELSHALRRNGEFNSVFLPNIFIGNHDVSRIASALKNIDDVQIALAVLCTIPGTPSIYYGDEQGWTGVKEKRPGGDDAIRAAYPAHPSELHGNAAIFEAHKKLLWFRRNNSWIANAKVNVTTLQNQFLVYDTIGDGNKITVALNLGDGPIDIPSSNSSQVLQASGCENTGGGYRLKSHGWAILS